MMVLLESPVPRDQKDLLDKRDLLVDRDQLDLMDLMAEMVILETPDLKVLL